MIDLAVVKLDLDRRFSACKWTAWCARIVETLDAADLEPASVEIRDTRRGHHVLLTLAQPMPDAFALIALQAMLGSDSVREAYNLRRAIAGRDDAWNVLYERKTREDGAHPVKSNVPFARILTRALHRRWPRVQIRVERLHSEGVAKRGSDAVKKAATRVESGMHS